MKKNINSKEFLFTSEEEIKLAKELEKKYLTDYNIESVSDRNMLQYLIYLEVLHITKLQKTANEFQNTNDAIPYNVLDAIHKNLTQILSIREKLGLNRKENKEEKDDYSALELLKKKFKVWAEKNQACRTLACPHCSQMILLKIRTEAWEAQKHPLFKDRLFGNEHLIRLYKENKLNKEDISKILGTSPDYVDWLVSKWNISNDTEELESGVTGECKALGNAP